MHGGTVPKAGYFRYITIWICTSAPCLAEAGQPGEGQL